jgi:hypothetical protein
MAYLLVQIFRGDLALDSGSPLRGLFSWRLAGAAAFMPTSRSTAKIARSRSLAVQSALVSNREVPAATRISTTYRGLRRGWSSTSQGFPRCAITWRAGG